MSQHYDILSVNVVLLLASGCGYMIVGQQNTGVVLLLLSLCNIVSMITRRIADLEQQRKEMELLADIENEEEEEAEEEEEEEAEEEEEEEQEDAQPPVTDVHYCGREQCGTEITNLNGAGLCAGCGLVYYCDTVCQRADWKAGHKLVCDRNTSVHSADVEADTEAVVEKEQEQEQEQEPIATLPPEPEKVLPVSEPERALPPPPLPPPPPPPPHATKAPYVRDMGFII